MWQKIKCLFGHHQWVEVDRGETVYSPNLFYVQEKCLGCGERRTRFVYVGKVKK